MSGRLDWDTDGRDWPNRAFSRFVRAGGLRWHVQVIGRRRAGPNSGRPCCCCMGPGRPRIPGARSHRCWRGGLHGGRTGFAWSRLHRHARESRTDFPSPPSLPGSPTLLRVLDLSPALVAGHSAGAAVAARLCLDGAIAPDALISINGALLPFPGPANDLFGPVARLLAGSRLASRAFALLAGSRSSVARLIRSTGSTIDAEGVRLYGVLAANPVHVAGALGLMANWDLRPLMRDLPRLTTRLILVAGDNDRMVPPTEISRIRALVPRAETVWLRGLGHLAHEERPEEIAALMERLLVHETAV